MVIFLSYFIMSRVSPRVMAILPMSGQLSLDLPYTMFYKKSQFPFFPFSKKERKVGGYLPPPMNFFQDLGEILDLRFCRSRSHRFNDVGQ